MGLHLLLYSVSLCQACSWHTVFATTLSSRDDTQTHLCRIIVLFFNIGEISQYTCTNLKSPAKYKNMCRNMCVKSVLSAPFIPESFADLTVTIYFLKKFDASFTLPYMNFICSC